MRNKKSLPQNTAVHNKIKFVSGLCLIVLASVGVVVLFYLVLQNHRAQESELSTLKDQVVLIQEEKEIIETRNAELAAVAGSSMSVDKLVQEADKVYDEKVKNAREGYLWIDRTSPSWLITLGALNGLLPGSTVAVYQEGEKVDTVQVETPLDVISYVKPTEKLKSQFASDYFRVVIE